MKTVTVRVTPKAANILSGLNQTQREQAAELGSKLVTDDHYAWLYFKQLIHRFRRDGLTEDDILQEVGDQLASYKANVASETKMKGGGK